MNKKALQNKIHALDFAIHELVLYLDTHPVCRKGMELLKEYRKKGKNVLHFTRKDTALIL